MEPGHGLTTNLKFKGRVDINSRNCLLDISPQLTEGQRFWAKVLQVLIVPFFRCQLREANNARKGLGRATDVEVLVRDETSQ